MRSSRSDRWLAVLVAMMVFAGAVSGTSAVIADTALVDPYIDQLAEAADTPTLSWRDCGDGFLCATAAVPLNYHHPHDEQIDLAVIKLAATDPGDGFDAGAADAKVIAASHPTALWCLPEARDGAVFVGEAKGLWLWALVWPETAGVLMYDGVILTDLRDVKNQPDIDFGSVSPRLSEVPATLAE